ncbi:hypothetical protein BOX15_Mlig003657g2, partial [Macrostomum lignano]
LFTGGLKVLTHKAQCSAMPSTSTPIPPESLGGVSSTSQSSSEDSAAVSEDSSTATSPASVSAKFRRRMQETSEPVMQRTCCPCCDRNFLKASELLASFKEHLKQALAAQQEQQKSKKQNGSELTESPVLHGMSQTESKIFLGDDFLSRLLARCNCDFVRASERLTVARTVHQKYTLDTSVSCKVCTQRPGFHSFRQVGFDRCGKPVLYTCLNQDFETGTQPEQVRDYLLHMILIVKEAEKTIPESQHSLVLVFDATGLGMNHVRTDTVSQFGEILRYFPARMSYALVLNMSRVTRFLLKPIIHLTGHQDDVVLLPSGNLEPQLSECFDAPLARWMTRESERNETARMPFWTAPEEASGAAHDPRGEPAYVNNFVKRRHPCGHRPHPSIVT